MHLKRYYVFISHPWSHHPAYERVADRLRAAKRLRWRNCSAPCDPPPGGPALTARLRDQIEPADVVLILADVYAHHRAWVQHQMDVARSLRKPILGFYPSGGGPAPAAVQRGVADMVPWATDSIVRAIRAYAPLRGRA